ncbi:MAG: 4Fe-4S binding protein [Syntrophorhabdaceae bacterium]|nr:4Fe-4S binding protein [Syntrophorhabdaceae bacterium]
MIPIIDRDLCTGCENCVEVCPPNAISMKDGKAYLEAEFCEECGFCASACPADAIRIEFPLLYP